MILRITKNNYNFMETDTTMENQILLCLEWLDLQQTTATMNQKHTSYSYKHIVEKWAGRYISEDAFIEAVKIRNLPFKRAPFTDKNIMVGLSEKTVRMYTDRIMKARKQGFRHVEGIKRVEL